MLNSASSNRRFYGWKIAVTLAVTETISWGIIYYAFSVFLTPMKTALGWSKTEISGAFSLSLLISGVMAFPVGIWIDRHGARQLMAIGSIVASLLVLAWSQVQTLSALYLIWIGLGICSAALLYEPAFAVIAVWFVKQRSRALALVTFVAGLASTIFLPLSDLLLHQFGWRSALILLALLLAITTIPLHFFILRRRPADLGLLPDGELKPAEANTKPLAGRTFNDAMKSRSFWLMTAAFSLSNLTSAAIRFHLIPLLIASGFSASTALVSGSIGILQVAGRVIFAPVDLRVSTRRIASVLFGLEAVAIFILFLNTTLIGVILFVAIFGAAYGAKTLARPSMLAELYGSSHYARISSIMAIFLTVTTTAAPVGASVVYDQLGTYKPLLIGLCAISLVSTLVMLFMRPESEQKRDVPLIEDVSMPA